MGLFDSYFDPEQFQDGGGLLGRLVSLQQQQGQYQPSQGFSGQTDDATAPIQPAVQQAPVPLPISRPINSAGQPDQQTQDIGPTQSISVGKYQMPQFGGADASQQPGIGDRLSAGFQSWAHTPVGSPFAAVANGISGFGSGQRTDAAGNAPPAAQVQAQSPDIGSRLNAGFQSWAHTPVGSPFAALANGIAGVSSGQRSDPAGVAQQLLQPAAGPANTPQQDLHSRYEAFRTILGDPGAMLAVINPEIGRTLVTQALGDRSSGGGNADADPARGEQSAIKAPTQMIDDRPPGSAGIARGNNPASWPRKPRINSRRSINNGQ